MFDYNDMVLFVKVVENGSFIEASRRLGVPKSTVSRKVAELENTLGVLLLQRTSRKLKLTDTGQAYFDRCVALVAGIEEANLAVTTEQPTPRGSLKVSAPITLGTHILGPWLMEFVQLYPEVELDVELTNRAVNLVEEQIDVTFRVGGLKDSSLIARKLWPAPYRLCANPSYLKRHGIPHVPKDILQHTCIRIRYTSTWSFVSPTGELETILPSGRIVVNDVTLACQAALAGQGLVYLPNIFVADYFKNEDLIPVLDDWPSHPRHVYAIYPTNRHLSAKVRALLDFIILKVKGRPEWFGKTVV